MSQKYKSILLLTLPVIILQLCIAYISWTIRIQLPISFYVWSFPIFLVLYLSCIVPLAIRDINTKQALSAICIATIIYFLEELLMAVMILGLELEFFPTLVLGNLLRAVTLAVGSIIVVYLRDLLLRNHSQTV